MERDVFYRLFLAVLAAILPSFAYDWDSPSDVVFSPKSLEQRTSILQTQEKCIRSGECLGDSASKTLRDAFTGLESTIVAEDSHATLFSYDELFLLYVYSAQVSLDKSASWKELVRLLEHSRSIKDSLAHRNYPFAKDSTLVDFLIDSIDYHQAEFEFSLLDVPRELKESFRIVLEAILVSNSLAKACEIGQNSHGTSMYGASVEFMETARDRFLRRYPQSEYGVLVREYVPEGFAAREKRNVASEQKWLAFSMGLGVGSAIMGGNLGETVSVPFEIPFYGEFQVGRALVGFGFGMGLGQKKTLWEGTSDEMEGHGFGMVMGGLNAYVGGVLLAHNSLSLDLLAGVVVSDYTPTSDSDYLIQGIGLQVGGQLDFKIPLTDFVEMVVRARYFFSWENAELYIPDAVYERRPEVDNFPSYGPETGYGHRVEILLGFRAGFPKSMMKEPVK